MKRLYAIFLACLFAAIPFNTFADEVDVTSKYLKNASFENGFTNWTQTDFKTQNNTSFTLKAGSYYVEKWVSSGKVGNAEVYQTLSNLPAGQYRLQAAAHNIQQSNADAAQTGAVIYAGSEKTKVTVTSQYSVEFTTLGEAINVGFKATSASGNWICVDNFKLYFIGEDTGKMLELLQTQITAAEKTLTTVNRYTPPLIQTAFLQALTNAIEEAKKLDATATVEQIQNAAVALDKANTEGTANYQVMSALKTLCTKAVSYTRDTKKMAEAYKEAIVNAYNAAQAVLSLESDADVNQTIEALQTAYDNANLSNIAYTALNKSITTANGLNRTDKEGAEELENAINAATAILEKADATPSEMDDATAALDKAVLIFRVANGSGTPISARTVAVIEGATELFARATFGSGTAKEKGFCWSEDNPEPTIYDERTTSNYSNNGNIYYIKDLKPATLYYVRAYTVSNNWLVSYGDVLKIYTRPLGNVSYDYDYAGDAATNQRIKDACEEGVWMWNNISGIQGFHLSAHYVPGAGAGDGTADCSYGGYMRVSQNTAYQKTGTILHEGAHGLGMVPYQDWTTSIYRTNGDGGDWLGPRVDRVIQFLENSATAKLHGDNQHMWPYGINGASEDSGSPILYRGNALLVGALAEDGIRTPNQDFLRPAYSFTHEEEAKYYLKSADKNYGLQDSYLFEGKGGSLTWQPMTSDEAFLNDSCAWTIIYNPKTCYYQFKNVATGRTINFNSNGKNGFRTSLNATNTCNLQLLSARAATTFETFTFETRSFWIVAPSSQASLSAVANNATSAVSFNHADNSTAQRWLILTADEVARFGTATGETVGVRSIEVAQQGTLRALGGKGVISITAVGSGADVSVCSVDGRQLRQLYVQQDATATLPLPRGIYIVGGQKVMVR